MKLYKLTGISSLINILLDMFNIDGESIYYQNLKKLNIDTACQHNLFSFFVSKFNIHRKYLDINNSDDLIVTTLVKINRTHRTVKLSKYVNSCLDKFSKFAQCSISTIVSAMVESTYTIELLNGNLPVDNSEDKLWYDTVCKIPKIDANVNIDELKEFANKIKDIENLNY